MRSFDDLVSLFYDAAIHLDRWPGALDALAERFQAVGALVKPFDRSPHIVSAYSPGLAAAVAEYRERWWRKNIRSQATQARGAVGVVVTDDLLFSAEDIEASEYHQKFLVPHGIPSAMWQVLEPLPGARFTVSVQRGPRRWSDEERSEFARIAAHVARAVALTARLQHTQAVDESLSHILARLHTGIVALDQDGRVVVANDAADDLSQCGLHIEDGYLRAQKSAQQERLEGLIATALRPDAKDGEATVAFRQEGRLRPCLVQAIRVRPAGADGDRLFHVGRVHCLVLIVDLDQVRPMEPAALLVEIGLTRSEARLAAAIGAGLQVKEAAQTLGLSESTARFVLKQVFAKLHVRRQSELVALLAQISIAA